jgi:predicted extracellular nuclease
MKKMIYYLLIVCIALNFAETQSQQARIAFYNTENFYDTRNDTLKNDEEFLPNGAKHWTYQRFRLKIVRLYQTFTAMGEGEMPAVIGLCEVENRDVLNSLIYDTPLQKAGYRIIHRDSPDARGVDVAILYRPDIFKPDTSSWLNVPLPENETTREILHVQGRLWGKDTIHIYVNHWPSRFGGAGASAAKRLAAASTLAASVKEVLSSNPSSNIVIMGDFNDEPGDESIQALNKIIMNDNEDSIPTLINLSEKKSILDYEGTIKHQGSWSIFDQVIVSPSMIYGNSGCIVESRKTEIFSPRFLLELDVTYTGFKPFRTYSGPSYNNGYSDHLPVSILVKEAE